jgi:hypothetical protein
LILHTGSEKTGVISTLHLKLLTDIASQLGLHIISIGSDGALVEFQAQTAVQKFLTLERFSVCYKEYGIDFNCPIFPNVGPVIRVQDPNHGRKTARNVCMSGARLLSFGNSTVHYGQLFTLCQQPESILYKQDVIKLDRQDDDAAFRIFCARNLEQLLDNGQLSNDNTGLFVYLFIMGGFIFIFIFF